MRRAASLVIVVLVTVMASDLTGFSCTHAQTGSGYDLTWYTIDNGGGSNSNGGYTLNGTIGQPDASAWSSGGYTFVGGFWGSLGPAPAPTQYRIYLPVVLRGT